MERLLMLRVQTHGCAAEVFLNDIPVGRIGGGPAPAGGQTASALLCLPVHEYLLEGSNDIRLVIDPSPVSVPSAAAKPKYAASTVAASLRLLLPRVGHVGSELQARTLAELDWAVAEGEIYHAPLSLSRSVMLPIKFPRWRWLDAPPLADIDSLKPAVAAYLQGLAIGLLRGDADMFILASRLRLDELAQAYQQPVGELASRLRARLQLLHATKALKLAIPDAADLLLRPCAETRLIECVTAGGEPVLRTEAGPDGTRSAWPLRLTVVSGQCHVLR